MADLVLTSGSEPVSIATSFEMALKDKTIARQARAVFNASPLLRDVSLRYVAYVSPFLEIDSRNLMNDALSKAITEASQVVTHPQDEMARLFITTLIDSVDTLRQLRLSVKDKNGDFVIWNYDEPLMASMSQRKRATIQIKRRNPPIDRAAVALKMLTNICSVQEMEELRIDGSYLR